MKQDGQFESYKEVIKFVSKLSHKKVGITEIYAERMRYLLAQLGQPEKKLKVVHITGTSGKGSVATLIGSIMRSSNLNVGVQTSPHLQSIRERTIVNGKYPLTSTYLGLANRVKKAFDKTVAKGSYGTPDYYQFLTAISLCWFVQRKIDIAVIEVGAGGYGDSTNVVTPTVSVITNVSLDHTGFMGKTMEEIAMVKAGIIKPDSSVVCGVTQPKIADIFAKRAKQLHCRFSSVPKLVRYKVKKLTADYVVADISTPTYKGVNVKIGLTGQYQAKNAGIAALTAKILSRKYGFAKITDKSITEGLEHAKIPGRFEILDHEPMVIIDGAHNQDKMKALMRLVKKVLANKDLYLILGFKSNKDVTSILKEVATIQPKKIIVTELPEGGTAPKSMKAKLVIKKMPESLRAIAVIKKRPTDALKYAIDKAPEDSAVLVTGSLYLVGELRNEWEEIE